LQKKEKKKNLTLQAQKNGVRDRRQEKTEAERLKT